MDEARSEYVRVWTSHAAMGVAGTAAVVLRLIARRRTKAPFKWDDWLIIFAALLMWSDFICTILEYRPYLRRVPEDDLPVDQHSQLMLISFVSIFFTASCEVFTRLSVVFLYYRLFSIMRWLGWSLKAVAALSLIWLAIVIVTVTMQCKPVAAVVDASIKGECLNVQFGFLLTEAINLALDLALVFLPIPIIWKLHLPLKERLGIGAIFLTGSVVIITQILRMIFGYNPGGGDRGVTSLAHLSVWTGLHLGFGLICACMPVCRIFLPKDDGPINSSIRRLYGTVFGWLGRTSPGSGSRPSQSSLPSFVHRPAEKKIVVKASDELPLTNITVLSEVEAISTSEHRRL